MDKRRIAEEVLAAVGGKDNVTANEICMTRLRIQTQDPALVDTDQLAAASGVLGLVHRGQNGIEVVFGPGKVEAIHEELVGLTGVDPQGRSFSPQQADPTTSPLLVRISDAAGASGDDGACAAATQAEDGSDNDDADDVDDLVSLLGAQEREEGAAAARVLVINGPNINMLGIREPELYGHDTYQQLLRTCHEAAREAGFSECSCFQSNHEGDLVDAIQDAYGDYVGIVINPGAYAHTSIAILDAARAVGLPMVEVHITRIEDREDYRQRSYIREACFETITGMGTEGYRKAIADLAEHIGL